MDYLEQQDKQHRTKGHLILDNEVEPESQVLSNQATQTVRPERRSIHPIITGM
jgi:hypothetical protein